MELDFQEKVLVLFISGVVVGFLMVILFSVVGLHINSGNGSQVGYVSAVETSGIGFKTHTAYIKPDLSSTQEDVYCVIDESVREELEKASVSKQSVKVTHFSWMFPGITNCAGESAIIKSVEVITK